MQFSVEMSTCLSVCVCFLSKGTETVKECKTCFIQLISMISTLGLKAVLTVFLCISLIFTLSQSYLWDWRMYQKVFCSMKKCNKLGPYNVCVVGGIQFPFFK